MLEINIIFFFRNKKKFNALFLSLPEKNCHFFINRNSLLMNVTYISVHKVSTIG